MGIEDLTGTKYIDDLNEAWPLGTDLPDAGDDHLRGIKNVLKKSFPNITGAVTLTDAQINRGSIPVGSVMAFYQAAAPAGWERVPGMTQTFGLRIIASDGVTGGTGGGTDDPVLNNKVATHTHDVNGASQSESANHSHNGTTAFASSAHNHGVNDPSHGHPWNAAVGGSGAGAGLMVASPSSNENPSSRGSTSAVGTGISIQTGGADHTHTFSTDGVSGLHTHVISITSGANASAANWTPRYLDMILCRRV